MKLKNKIILYVAFFLIFPLDIVRAVSCETGYKEVSGVCVPSGTGLSEKSVANVLTAIATWLFSIIGFLATIGFFVSGIMYITAAGDKDQIDKAKKAMVNSIIGITVALMGAIIVTAIDSMLRGQTNF